MKKHYLLICLLLFTSYSVSLAQNIKWVSMQEAEKLSKENDKPILIDIYTDWCHWCKVMDSTTYKDRSVVEYINDNYYAVKLNAESNEKITHAGQKTTKAKLASQFGVSGYPATMLVHPDGAYKLINEMKTSHAFLHTITKFHHQDNLHHKHPEDNNSAHIHWVAIDEAIKMSKKDGKPVFVSVYTDWCGPCKMMDKNTYSHADVAKYLNENFHPVKLNADDHREVKYYHEDIKQNQLIHYKFGVKGYPSIVVFKYKATPSVHTGYNNPTQLIQLLQRYQ